MGRTPMKASLSKSVELNSNSVHRHAYQMLGYGASGCIRGNEIESKDECLKAVGALGLKTDYWHEYDQEDIPSGCSYRDEPAGHPNAHFNKHAAGSGREDLAPVCYYGYKILPHGADGCSDGLDIESKDDCLSAIGALGLRTDYWHETDQDTIPSGCSYRDEPADHPNAHFNRNAAGCGRNDLA